jgi:hypothetical protein
MKVLSTDAVIALIVCAFVTYLAKWLASKDGQKFKQYEGYAVMAIKAAEKAIPDGTANKGMNRLDFAMKSFLVQYEKATGVKASEADVAKIESWISTIHAALESSGSI